jgi:hypothetical protein
MPNRGCQNSEREKKVFFHEWFIPQDGEPQQAKRNHPGSCRGVVMHVQTVHGDQHAHALLCWMDVKATLKAAAFGDDEMAHLPLKGLRALATVVGLLCCRRPRCRRVECSARPARTCLGCSSGSRMKIQKRLKFIRGQRHEAQLTLALASTSAQCSSSSFPSFNGKKKFMETLRVGFTGSATVGGLEPLQPLADPPLLARRDSVARARTGPETGGSLPLPWR